jgi:FMN phosphatase YigB (HAD superfamily)
MTNWMRELSLHYEIIRNNYPDDKLLILFDIDGTILDMRYTIKAMLKSYDKQFNTAYFTNLEPGDIDFAEEDLEQALVRMGVEFRHIGQVLDWYCKNRWSNWVLNEAHIPFPGVLDVIRWLQLHRNTYVGLNTARIERLREQTLLSLNRLGKEYRVRFDNDLLLMNRTERKTEIAAAKVDAIRSCRQKGYRVVAVIDNEPDILDSIAQMEQADEILLLHARTLFNFRRTALPARAVNGNVYDLTELVRMQHLPRHIQLVWSNIQDTIQMDGFLASNVQWGDITDLVNRVYYANKFGDTSDTQLIDLSMYEHMIGTMAEMQKGARLDLISEFIEVNGYLEVISRFGFRPDQLWFRVNLDRFNGEDIRQLAAQFPGATIECQADFLTPLLLDADAKLDQLLARLELCGVNRFGVDWHTRKMKQMVEWLDDTGRNVALNNVCGYDAFLQAVLLGPRAIISDFSFPEMSTVTEPVMEYRQAQ